MTWWFGTASGFGNVVSDSLSCQGRGAEVVGRCLDV